MRVHGTYISATASAAKASGATAASESRKVGGHRYSRARLNAASSSPSEGTPGCGPWGCTGVRGRDVPELTFRIGSTNNQSLSDVEAASGNVPEVQPLVLQLSPSCSPRRVWYREGRLRAEIGPPAPTRSLHHQKVHDDVQLSPRVSVSPGGRCERRRFRARGCSGSCRDPRRRASSPACRSGGELRGRGTVAVGEGGGSQRSGPGGPHGVARRRPSRRGRDDGRVARCGRQSEPSRRGREHGAALRVPRLAADPDGA